MEFDLGRSLLGSRLKDLRTVLVYLRHREDIDGSKLALWGQLEIIAELAPPVQSDTRRAMVCSAASTS